MSYTRIDDEVESYIVRQIASGFADPLELGELAAAVYEVDVDTCDELVDAAVEAHERARESWPAVTDCDRLDRAFADLDASGVLARQHFACCNSCGNYEMGDVIHDAREQGRRVDGYVFYHWQDTDAAIEGEGLSLRYHSTNHEDDDTAAIGRRTVEALRAHGLATTWDGDPARTIEVVPFDWKRRSPPAAAKPVVTAENCLARWCDELPRMTASDLACAVGDRFGEAAIAAGDVDLALAWARAHRIAGGRSSALGRVAAALRGAPVPASGPRELLLEAVACAPWGGRAGAMVDLLVDADLSDPDVAAAMRRRVLESRGDVRGAVEVAWFVVRAGLHAEEETHFLEQIEAARARPDRYSEHTAARLALDAALWVLRARRGEADAAGEARQRMLDVFISLEIYSMPASSIRAVIAAARMVADLAPIMEQVRVQASAYVPELVDACIATGDVNGAIALDPQGVLAHARLAQLRPQDVHAPAWFAAAEAADAGLDEAYREGLCTVDEVALARLALVAARAQHSDRAAARDALTALARTSAAALADAARGCQATVEAIAAGASTPTFRVEEHWLTPDGEAALAKALAKWEAATDRRTRFRARRQCGKVLAAAAAFARHGHRARAVGLVDRALAGGDEVIRDMFVDAPLAGALVATDQLDRALALTSEQRLEADGTTPLVIGLVEHGRTDEALALIGGALDRAATSAELHALAPAVLAVAGDRAAAAPAMVAAFTRAAAAAAALTR